MRDSPSITAFGQTLDLRQRLLEHPLYAAVSDLPEVAVFMQHHVFAVWDFMSLLKRLQLDLTTCRVPWVPPQHPDMARFINEIVLGEESDVSPDGEHYQSHFDLYRAAMDDVHAPAEPIDEFLRRINRGASVSEALGTGIPDFVRTFVRANCDLAANGSTHEVAAAFCFGREDIIPEMFAKLLHSLERNAVPAPALSYYVQRHIEVDGDHHGPLSMRLIDTVIGDSAAKQADAIAAARDALHRRIELWDGVYEAVLASKRQLVGVRARQW